jgi:hypothetical protein
MTLLLLQTNQSIVAAGRLIFDSKLFSSMTFSIRRELYSCKVQLHSYVKICKHTYPMNGNITKAAISEVRHILYTIT